MSISMVKNINGNFVAMSNKTSAWNVTDFDEIIELAAMWRDFCRESVDYGFILGGGHYVSVETIHQHRESLTLGGCSLLSLSYPLQQAA